VTFEECPGAAESPSPSFTGVGGEGDGTGPSGNVACFERLMTPIIMAGRGNLADTGALRVSPSRFT